jgi:hypothetical protein
MPEGILKADWFAKQRQRRAAVALAIVDRCARAAHGAARQRASSGAQALITAAAAAAWHLPRAPARA